MLSSGPRRRRSVKLPAAFFRWAYLNRTRPPSLAFPDSVCPNCSKRELPSSRDSFGVGMKQKEAAQQFGVTQPRISDLMRGKIDLFSIDTLVIMLTTAGLHVDVRVREAS